MRNYPSLESTTCILQTSEAGERSVVVPNVRFAEGDAQSGVVINVFPDESKQTLLGIGTSFNESAAFVLAHLDPDVREQVMRDIYGEEGANFSLARTVIGSTDFSVEGHYSYIDDVEDRSLESFDLSIDLDGFDRDRYPGVRDEGFDLIPMIEQARAIKSGQDDPTLNLIASAWTAPPWMKDIGDWHIGGSEANGWQGTGGSLKQGYEQIYTDYLLKYLAAYKERGIPVWGMTPVNEPGGNNGQWESMNFTAESQRDFIKDHLGPGLHENGFEDVHLLMFDHNRDHIDHWADVIYSDTGAAKYLHGAAVHWYSSTYKVYEEKFDAIHDRYPEMAIIHTEGTVDDLGKPAPPGVLDPEGFQEKDWFGNDAFWWNDNATDWAYTVTWDSVDADDHPKYAPVHRYARDIIVGFDHWMSGWIDWNNVLDARGGPNHVGNFCGAPIMIDTASGEIYYTPVFHVLSQLSRTIRPGDRVVVSSIEHTDTSVDDVYAVASLNGDQLLTVQVLNTSKQSVDYHLQIGDRNAAITIPANSLQTVQLRI